MQLRELTMQQFNEEVLSGTGEMLVQITQNSCMPCKVVESQFAGIVESKGINVTKINLDNSPEFQEYTEIMSTPTVLQFQDGVLVERFDGKGKSMSVVAKHM